MRDNHNISKTIKDLKKKKKLVVNNIAPLKTVVIKNISSELFHMEIVEQIRIRNKLFKKFKSTCLNIN